MIGRRDGAYIYDGCVSPCAAVITDKRAAELAQPDEIRRLST